MNIEQHFNLSGHNIVIIDNWGIQHFFVYFYKKCFMYRNFIRQ